MHLDFSELLRQGGAGVIAYFAMHALVVIWRRLTKREDAQLSIALERCIKLEAALEDRDKHIEKLHADQARAIEKLHRERVQAERMVVQAAIAQSAVTKVTRDALDAMSENHRELVSEVFSLRGSLREALSSASAVIVHEVQEEPKTAPALPARKPLADELHAPSAPEPPKTTPETERSST